jgi:hypothetical protein
LTGLYNDVGYSKKRFETMLGSLVSLRNRVAHPTRTLVNAGQPVKRLWNRIDRAEELIFQLR